MEGDPITPLRRAFSTPPLPRQRTHYVVFWGAGVDDDEYPPSKKDCSLARGALGEIRPAEQGHRARGGDRVAKPILSLQGVEVALFCPQIVDYQSEFVGSFILSPRFT